VIADRLMRGGQLPLVMSRIPYPCWGLKFDEKISDSNVLISAMNDSRKDDSWLLLGGPAAVSERQLWTAWLGLSARHANDTMRANSVDVEFIRLIAGTHQIRIGFERAGIQNGDDTAWLVHLPEFPTGKIQDVTWPSLERHELDLEANRLMTVLGADLLPHLPMPSENSVERLELEIESGGSADFNAIERSALAHITLADFS